MTRHLIPVTRAEVVALLAARRSPFPGFVPDDRPSDVARLREHLGDEPLRGQILSEDELVRSAVQRAEQAERESKAKRAAAVAAVPIADRFADAPMTRKLLGLADPPQPERPASPLDRVELGPAMRRLLGRPQEDS